jgi:hypothetical protein
MEAISSLCEPVIVEQMLFSREAARFSGESTDDSLLSGPRGDFNRYPKRSDSWRIVLKVEAMQTGWFRFLAFTFIALIGVIYVRTLMKAPLQVNQSSAVMERRFETNAGQTDPRVRFLFRSRDYTCFSQTPKFCIPRELQTPSYGCDLSAQILS